MEERQRRGEVAGTDRVADTLSVVYTITMINSSSDQLTIELSPELKQRLQHEAAGRGLSVAEYARLVLEGTERAPSFWDSEEPADLIALARAQGTPLAARFEDLRGDFWPEDETADEFIAAVREWRREGNHPSP
jgi:hypothetical protein